MAGGLLAFEWIYNNSSPKKGVFQTGEQENHWVANSEEFYLSYYV